MYFTRESQKTEALIESFRARNNCVNFAREIQEGGYFVFYHFEEADDSLIYEFIDPEGDNYISVSVNAKGDIMVPEEYLSLAYHEPPFNYGGACLYLYDREKRLVEENRQKEVYGEDYEKLVSLLSLTPRQLDRRASVRREFIALFDWKYSSITSSAPTYEVQNELKVSFSFEQGYNYYGEESYSLKLVLMDGKERLGLVRSNNSFLNAYENGSIYSIRGGLRIDVSRKNFDESTKAALDYYLSRIHFRKEASVLVKSDVVSLLFALKGENVNFEGKDYLILDKVGAAGFRFSPDESLHFFPAPPSNSTLLLSGSSLACFDKSNFVCELFTFKKPLSADLFLFYRNHGSNETDLIKDLVQSYVPPEDALPMEEGGEITDSMQISLYVDMSERGILLFSTICHLNGHEETMEKLRENLYYREKLNRYASILSHLGGVISGAVRDEGDILHFLSGDLSELRSICSVYLSEAISRLNIKRVGPIDVVINKNAQNWLELRISSAHYDDDTLKLILSQYKKKHRYVRLGDDIIVLEDPYVHEAALIQREVGIKDELYTDKLPFYNAFKLASASITHVGLNLSDYVIEAIDSIRNYTKKKILLPQAIQEVVRPYQKEAIQWMSVLSGYGLSGILADDMGLGKTLEAIAFLSGRGDSRPTLVICPKSVTYNWESEVHKWNPDMPVCVVAGSKETRLGILSNIKKRERGIYVVSYDSLRNDIEEFSKVHFGVVLADEAQFIKNSLSKKAKAVKTLKSDIRFALTGTPIENSLLDLWSIFDFLMPGYLLSYEEFKQQYIDADSSSARDKLLKRITPFILRRSKSQVLKDLPIKSVETITLAMNEYQSEFYEASLLEARKEIEENEKSEEKNRLSIFPILTKLREIAVDPGSFFDNFTEISTKFEYVTSLAETAIASGHKLLIFSSFTKVLENMELALRECDIDSRTISGSTPAQERLLLAEEFNSTDHFKVMLVSLKAGGTGLNLIGADIVIHLDPWWNPAAEEQATDRSYRIGQTRPVSVYKLVCHNSIEEKVLILQEAKKDLSDSLIKEGDSLIRKLSDEDIRFLLS
ncbi:MAG: DEAD/DEAH box helicase [Bacilli bacterium]|nr:DEAD/DEAH box helicase [Bacilli bacterium]